MTLDPVHFDGIARLAGRISRGVDTRDHHDFARTVWEGFLDPLVAEGVAVIEPLGERRRRRVAVEDAALAASPFGTQHGLDAGTINPTTFTNGLVLDVAQAAMSAVPSDLELHRSRTIVATVHANDATVSVEEGDWTKFDAGYSRERIIQAPRVDRFEQQVVHALSLYLAESDHALEHADAVEELLVLDGPLYPKGLLEWTGRDRRLGELLAEAARPKAILRNYLELVERFVERDVPLIGFIKHPSGRALTRTVRGQTGRSPWVDDAAFFRQVLDPGDGARDRLTCSSWFVSRGGVDRALSAEGDALGVDRALDPAAYEVTFFVVYDPREELLFRVEAPRAFTEDPETRERLTRQVLQDVAVGRGPPLAVAKADELARISRDEKAGLTDALERELAAERTRTYDETRWGEGFDG
ncbi:MAG: DNA double-strand break repair nuclease NurA [Halobacteriales archaeon]|nr:DNA double-strand break repair nuclease NurA [Halobacteriales archaeon]